MTALAPTDAELARLAASVELRGGVRARRAAGSYFTGSDVARHLARRAIGAALLDAAGAPAAEVELLLAEGADPVDRALGLVRSDDHARTAIAARTRELEVLDPSCGAGVFLAEAWRVLVAVADALDLPPAGRPRPSQLLGVDIDPDAAAACSVVLEQLTGAAGARISVGDAQRAGVVPPADVVLGNPPYVRARAGADQEDLATRSVPNRSAWIVERALAAARPGARTALVLPISTSCTDAFAPARDAWSHRCASVHTSHFDTIPSTLFEGVVQRLSIYEGRVRGAGEVAPCAWYTSRYHRWTRDERDGLLARIRQVPAPAQSVGGSIAKVGTELERDLLASLFAHPPAGRWFATAPGSNRIRYKRRWSYFLLFCDFVPPLWDSDGALREPSELKSIDVDPRLDARVLLATYSSTLFWWYFSVFTDNRNVNRRDLAGFPLPDLESAVAVELAALGAELMDALRACAEVRTCTYRSIGTIHNTYYRQAGTRPVLDRIDHVLARAYGLTQAQLEFVLGFERRFRS